MLIMLLFWALAFGIFVFPFLRGPSQVTEWGAPDPTRKVALADEDSDDAPIDRVFTDDVASFDEEGIVEESLSDHIQAASDGYFAPVSAELIDSGLLRFDRLENGQLDYEMLCAGCHGLIGNGAGPAARYLNPRPRNFRKGLYKFVSSAAGARPRREDMFRTITHGLAGSSMPGFWLLPEGRRWSLVEYVRLLAIRGEFEQAMLDWAWADEELPDPAEVFETVTRQWTDEATAEVFPTVPEPEFTEDTVAKGRELFLAQSGASCISCHGAGGEGDGPAADAMIDGWGYPIRPRNLTTGVYRSGGSSKGLWMAIANGIGGSGMPAYAGALSGEDIWHLVHFIQSLVPQGKDS